MPSYEYFCEPCDASFEELLISTDDVRRYSREHPCPACGRPCQRIPSAANFSFKGQAFGDPTNKTGSSGVHDLDYPSLDKAVGRSANRKWKEYRARKGARDAARRELGTNAVSESREGQVVAADPKVLDAREKGLKLFKKAREQSG